jgi:hypothetical protein
MLTAWVVTSSEQDASGGLADANNVTGSRSTQNAVLANNEFLDSISSSNLCNELSHFWVPVATITSNDQGASFNAFGNGEQDGGNKSLTVVWLLKDLDLFTKPRPEIVRLIVLKLECAKQELRFAEKL